MFIFSLIAFLIIAVVALYFPGRLVLGKRVKDTDSSESFFLSVILGIAIIILETIITGTLKIRPISLPLLLTSIIISAFIYHKDLFVSLKALFSNRILVVIVLLGVLMQGFINFPSGWKYSNGVNFWSSQGHDGLWHVSLMEEVKNTFPPANPLYAGHPMQNYHFTSDIFMGEFYRLFPIFTSLDLYFRFYPIVFSVLIGLGVFTFAKRHWNEGSAYWAVFFTQFCGSFGYIVSILKHQFPLSGETTFWASQGNTILGNPPHAMGIIFLTTILLIFSIWMKSKDKYWLILIFLLGFGLATIKVSSGLVLVLGFLTAGAYSLIFKKDYRLILLGVLLGIGNFLTLKIISPTAQSFILFEPLWFPRTMMVVRLDWVDWELRRQHYMWVNTWRSWLREISLELQAISLFIIGNTGMRILGIGEIISKSRKKINPVDVFLISSSMAVIVILLLFVQKGITFNLIQFIQIYLHFMGLYAGAAVYSLLKKIKPNALKVIIALVIVSASIPTAIGNLFDFYGPGHNPLATVSNEELSALKWIKDNTPKDSIIFTKPFNRYGSSKYKSQPIPISAWYPTMYVHSFTGRHTFLTGEEQLSITGYDSEIDLKNMDKFMQQKDPVFENEFLKNGQIDYLYFRFDELEEPLNLVANNLSEVYKNTEVVIYQYDQNK